MTTIAGAQTKIKDERTPILSEKLRRSLAQAGPTGRTTVQLAIELYGDSDYPAQHKVKQLVRNLRRRGHKILTVRDRGYLAGRYILAEYALTAVPR